MRSARDRFASPEPTSRGQHGAREAGQVLPSCAPVGRAGPREDADPRARRRNTTWADVAWLRLAMPVTAGGRSTHRVCGEQRESLV